MVKRYMRPSRVLVLLTALMLVFGMMLGSISVAYAATVPTTVRPNADLTVNKLLQTASANQWPASPSFNFLLTAIGYSGGPATPHTAYDENNLPMPGGDIGGTYNMTATGFSTTATGASQNKVSNKATIAYKQMGVYTYKITEVVPTNAIPGLVYDTSEYYMNVYVQNVVDSVTNTVVLGTDGQPLVSVSSITTYRGANTTNPANPSADPITGTGTDGKQSVVTPTTPGATTANSLASAVSMVNNYQVQPMIISKQVSGNMGDITQDFTFQVKLLKPNTTTADSTMYSYTIYNYGTDGIKQSDGTGDDAQVSTGTTTNNGTVPLKHNQYMVINGLPIGEKVTITEQAATDYKTSITGVNGTTVPTPKTDLTANKTLGQVTLENGTNTQDFVNKKDAVTPTGVWMNVWPYVLIGGIAIAGIVLWMMSKRKRKIVSKQGGAGL